MAFEAREVLERHLAESERHIVQAEGHVARQREIVAQLERDGQDSGAARALLAQFETTLTEFIADRDRIKAELTQKPSP